MRRIINILIYFSLVFYAITGNGCNSVPEQMIINNEFNPNLMNNVLKKDTFYLFNPIEGFQQNFSGIRIKTNIKVGFDSTTETEPIYYRVTTLKMSVPTFNGEMYGSAGFEKADICNWDELIQRMKLGYNPLGRIIKYYLKAEDLESILKCDSAKYFSSSDSNSIIEAFSTIINDFTFYQQYRDTINAWIFDPNTLDTLNNEVKQMVAKNIFIDMNGNNITSHLGATQQEELKWFNWLLLTKYLDDKWRRVLTKYPATPRVFSILFQQGTSQNQLHQYETIRYLTISNKMMDQILNIYNDTLINFDNFPYTKVSSYKISTRSPWIVGPLFNPSDIPFISASDLLEVYLPGDAIVYLVRYSNNADTIFYNLKCYYSLCGTVQQNSQPLDIAGTITINADLFKLVLNDQGYFLSWDTEINIRKKNKLGEITIYRENRTLKADNG